MRLLVYSRLVATPLDTFVDLGVRIAKLTDLIVAIDALHFDVGNFIFSYFGS